MSDSAKRMKYKCFAGFVSSMFRTSVTAVSVCFAALKHFVISGLNVDRQCLITGLHLLLAGVRSDCF